VGNDQFNKKLAALNERIDDIESALGIAKTGSLVARSDRLAKSIHALTDIESRIAKLESERTLVVSA
jgi:archaellum component FlaC